MKWCISHLWLSRLLSSRSGDIPMTNDYDSFKMYLLCVLLLTTLLSNPGSHDIDGLAQECSSSIANAVGVTAVLHEAIDTPHLQYVFMLQSKRLGILSSPEISKMNQFGNGTHYLRANSANQRTSNQPISLLLHSLDNTHGSSTSYCCFVSYEDKVLNLGIDLLLWPCLELLPELCGQLLNKLNASPVDLSQLKITPWQWVEIVHHQQVIKCKCTNVIDIITDFGDGSAIH